MNGRSWILPTLVMVTFAAGALPDSDAWAQACAGPAAAGVTPLPAVPTTVYPEGPGALGDNLVEIPAFSPINGPGGGFAAICGNLGLPSGTALIQFNAATGTVVTHLCGQVVAAPYTPCQGVLIRPSITITGTMLQGPVEGSWPYPIYGDGPGPLGDHLFGIPRTMADVNGNGVLDPEDVCIAFGLPTANAASSITRFNAQNGSTEAHICGTIPQFTLVRGESVLIRSNCAPAGVLCGVGAVPVL